MHGDDIADRVQHFIEDAINAVIDEGAGTESGRITSLNPTSAAKKK